MAGRKFLPQNADNDSMITRSQTSRLTVGFQSRKWLLLAIPIVSIQSCKSELKVTTSGGKNAGNCKSSATTNCDTATNLKWSETTPVSGLQAKATWTPAADSKLLNQKIQFYTGASCNQTSGSEIEISGAATATYILTVKESQVVTYKIISQFAATSTTSDCSAAMTFLASSTSASITPSTSASSDTTAPTISSITTKSTMTSTASAAITFTISDNTTLACTSQYLFMTSSNTTVVANSSVTWSGTYPNCSAVITPEAGATGTPTITFTVRDSAGLNANTNFLFHVTSAFALGQSSVSDIDGFRVGLVQPFSILRIGSKWLISNSDWARINVYESEPVVGSHTPSAFIGQSTHLNREPNQGLSAPTSSTLSSPAGMTSYGSALIVADSGNNRVLIWNTVPTSSGAAADVVIGQTDFTGGNCNQGGSAAANTLCSPRSVKIIGTKLYVADSGNARVLIWNTVPTANNASASLVIGQPDFTTTSSGVSATKFSGPWDLDSDGTKLAIADGGAARVLIYNTLPTNSSVAADVVIGQTNFTSSVTGLTSQNFAGPLSLTIANSRLYVADGNPRILVWTSIPTTNNTAANYVIGQPNMTTANIYYKTPTTGSTHSGIGKVSYIDGKIYAPDGENARILVFNSAITGDGQAADYVIGQPSLFSQTIAHHQGNYPSYSYVAESEVYINSNGTDLQVSDIINNRILLFNSMPTSYSANHSTVIGQTNVNQRLEGVQALTASALSNPTWSLKIGSKFIGVDSFGSRVLIWNSIPTTDNQAASNVIGQTNLTTLQHGTTASRFTSPRCAATDGTKLFISDSPSHRILVWNSVPTTDNSSANFAIGQVNLTSGTSGTTASTMYGPSNIQIVGSKLFVADTGNNRILIWNTLPTASGSSANVAIGQPNLTSGTANNGGISASTLSNPQGVFSDGTKLFVADTDNNRILVWNTIPTTSGQPADAVIGQPDFTSSSFSYFNISHVNYYRPTSLYYTGTKLLIADKLHRVVFLDYP
jgi:hypothetical protein